VYPTVLDVIGARPPRDISGHSLTPKTNAQPEGRVSYSNWGSWLAVRNDRYSLVLEGAKRESRVYDLDADPHERAPLAIADRRTDTRDLENLSRRWVEVMGARVEGKTETRGSKELVERLRSLGYVQ
jgi:arylsulfatase A-like enzyme